MKGNCISMLCSLSSLLTSIVSNKPVSRNSALTKNYSVHTFGFLRKFDLESEKKQNKHHKLTLFI